MAHSGLLLKNLEAIGRTLADAESFRLFYQAEQEALAETGDEIGLDGGPLSNYGNY